MYKREEAVSPVIGVILMVAITVILAAVIAAFVFGMAGNVNKTKSIGVVAEQVNGTAIVVTNHGGKDQSELAGLYVNATTIPSGGQFSPQPPGVGASAIVTATSGKDHVTVIAYWVDGSSQVVLDTYV